MSEELNYIDPIDISESINKPNNFIIIDVRSQEKYELGHIPGAINIPSILFEDNINLEKIYNDYKEKTIVIHCFKSRNSGPTCARQFIAYVDSKDLIKPEIIIMKGGFEAYNSLFHDDPTKIATGIGN
uniref:protein-tyrosine-phosphatase n=1 Tax=Chromulina nebulosa TaxID=96789 RepID=A0A7S0SSE2_9STRA|mmetsp:Transcript_1938/g.1736  ORF Transcript_1938/g.1736 Transcript_1938/m.1736 type:complete len:128 (+) Transcript_1938:62-445(+)